MKQFFFLSALLIEMSLFATPAKDASCDADIKKPDGTILKGTYFAAGKSGPGVLLFHQSNRTRKSWDDVARQLAAAGINTLTVDVRGHGDTGGNFDNWSGRASRIVNLFSYLRSLGYRFFQRSQIDTELEPELQAHIDFSADELEGSGLTRAEAERRARIEFGGESKFKEECREAIAGIHNCDDPHLELGIGATTAIFRVVDGVVLKPLSYPHPEQKDERQ